LLLALSLLRLQVETTGSTSALFFPNQTMDNAKLLSVQEISKHKVSSDSWLVVEGQVWDVTKFAPEHPGGAASKP
jgi:cytochrome b involved in lipid metabolism